MEWMGQEWEMGAYLACLGSGHVAIEDFAIYSGEPLAEVRQRFQESSTSRTRTTEDESHLAWFQDSVEAVDLQR